MCLAAALVSSLKIAGGHSLPLTPSFLQESGCYGHYLRTLAFRGPRLRNDEVVSWKESGFLITLWTRAPSSCTSYLGIFTREK